MVQGYLGTVADIRHAVHTTRLVDASVFTKYLDRDMASNKEDDM